MGGLTDLTVVLPESGFDGVSCSREAVTSFTATSIALEFFSIPSLFGSISLETTGLGGLADTEVHVDAGVAICVSGTVDVTDSVSATECCSDCIGESNVGNSCALTAAWGGDGETSGTGVTCGLDGSEVANPKVLIAPSTIC